MKTKININKKSVRNYALVLIAGLLSGWLLFYDSAETKEAVHDHSEQAEKATVWTCSMHPQIKMEKPGKCPICNMDLIPLETSSQGDEAVNPDEITMSESAVKLAEIQTMSVRRDYSNKDVYLLGKVKPDERNIAELTARFGGRIEKLFVNFTGQNVKKGEKLATIYSPDLVTAQKELLESMEYKESHPSFYRAARNKLKLWDLTDTQINEIEEGGEPQTYFDVLSPISGTVTMRHVAMGDYTKEGNALFQVVDLTHLWVMFEAYESDLPWLKKGDKAEFTVQSLPGETFNGKVTYIDPFLDSKTRIAYVRVEVNNPKLALKPEMFANGIIHPGTSGNQKDLLIPKTSVLWTGKRAVVYVKVPGREHASFLYREIVLGPEAGDLYVVKEGLSEGEEIAVNGVFKIDAAAQLEGKPSMMNH
ncbi:MAG: efflux RND transporter periplasmic adaptor subunit [Bacteroidales bacterium]|nr:efflux RND transporter periplasmic adaptor subunit [Bacteroidales bacterium]